MNTLPAQQVFLCCGPRLCCSRAHSRDSLTCPHRCPPVHSTVRHMSAFGTCAILNLHTHTHRYSHTHSHTEWTLIPCLAASEYECAQQIHMYSFVCMHSSVPVYMNMYLWVWLSVWMWILCCCCCRYTGLLVHLTCLIIIVIGVYFAFIWIWISIVSHLNVQNGPQPGHGWVFSATAGAPGASGTRGWGQAKDNLLWMEEEYTRILPI